MTTTPSCLQCGRPYDPGVVVNRFAGVCPACLARFAAGGDSDVQPGPAMGDPSMKPPLKLGGTFHGLEIIEMIGAGGMGVVYKTRQIGLDRFVALKVLSPKLSEDPEFAARFNREAKTMAALSHPGIVQVFDYGQEGGLCFLVMEFVDGVSLRDFMRARTMDPSKALQVVPRICEALEYAHSKGVVHRDIKPENILVDREGRVKIADFGLARMLDPGTQPRLTITNAVMGTPGYMAPEQYQSMQVDHRADIYSLGAVFYELLTGELPVGRFDPPSSKVQIDVRLDEIVLKTLATRPESRYQRAVDVQTAVEEVGSHAGPLAPESRPVSDPWMPWLVRVLLPAVSFFAGILAGEGFLVTTFGPPRSEASGIAWMIFGFAFAGAAHIGIRRWDIRWGFPIVPWRWGAAMGFFLCGLVAFVVYGMFDLLSKRQVNPGFALGAAIVALYLAWIVRTELRKGSRDLGDAHLPRKDQDPFRASTLAAASLAVACLSYMIVIIAAIGEETLQGWSRRTWQNSDAMIWPAVILQCLALAMAAAAILRKQVRSGRIQAYVALSMALPPIGMMAAVYHLFLTEPRIGGGGQRKESGRISTLATAACLCSWIGILTASLLLLFAIAGGPL